MSEEASWFVFKSFDPIFSASRVTAELGEAIVACLPVETMREIPVTPATTAATDVLIGITDVLLEVHQAVTGDALCAAVHNFRCARASNGSICCW